MESLEEKKSIVSTELEPLILPEGIPEDELPKVIINILLRRALFEKNPMSKWVLLGALEVLQGRTPKLTATMLSNVVKVSQQSDECNLLSRTTMKNQQYNKMKSSSIIYESIGIQVDILDSRQFVDKACQINIIPTTKDMDVQCDPLTHSKAVQCEPSTRTNWAQTLMKPKLVSNWSQTPINHSETHILPLNDKKDPIKKSKGDVNESVKEKESNGDTEKSLKHNKGKVDVAENLKQKKDNGDTDKSPKHIKTNLDVAENVKHKKSNEDAENTLKHNKSKLDEAETLKYKKSNGGADNSSKYQRNVLSVADALKHIKRKDVVDDTFKHNERKEDTESSCKSKDVLMYRSWKVVEVDGIPDQRKQANRLKITTFEVKIPLIVKAKLQDPRLQK